MEISWVLDLVTGARELANAARVEPSRRSDDKEIRRVKEIVEALRFIYFAPRGVISLLQDLADGVQPSQEQIETILPRFNDGDPFVQRMMWRLSPPEGHSDGVLTLRAEKVLREIYHGKGGVREKVKSLLNEALTYGDPVSQTEAKELLREIVELNTAIEDAEEALVKSLKG